MILHIRAHEMGKRPRLRIWTDDMRDYGQFNVVDFNDVEAFLVLVHKLSIATVKLHHCDGLNNDCNCHILTYGESLESTL